MDCSTLGDTLRDLLHLRLSSVAISFQQSVPEGVDRVSDAAASGCTYWKLAGNGRVFYTEASDHFNCTIGAYTHNVALPEDKSKELEEMVGTMVQLDYITMDEVQELPRRTESFGVAVYSPLEKSICEPDVVIVRGNAKQIMLVAEAARAAGVGDQGAAMGRPACAMIPQAMQTSHGTTSLGCIGNRVYTELADDELYFVIPGEQIEEVVGKLDRIVRANEQLETMHRERCAR